MINIFWFRRDLRLEDNHGLSVALSQPEKVQPIFIFDKNILDELEENDARVTFIHDLLSSIDAKLKEVGSSLKIYYDTPVNAFDKILSEHDVKAVYANEDYEPYAINRDTETKKKLDQNGVQFFQFKDHVIFEKGEVLKSDGKPYTVYTPYKKRWLARFTLDDIKEHVVPLSNFCKVQYDFPTLAFMGFERSNQKVKPIALNGVDSYGERRDYPSKDAGSNLGPHLRFGSVSVRSIIRQVGDVNSVFVSELIWRDFFIQILYHFPHVLDRSFKSKYDNIPWRNDEEEFQKWCQGQTGYPLVDAGMRELNETGYMHNRVRMVVASFLVKHLLIDWRWGEAYFAEKLLDFELASNNGNWQWAAGCGCDAAPYFRVFNPIEQLKKFDGQLEYVKRWVPEFQEFNYPKPVVEHKFARERVLDTFKKALN